MVTDVVAIAAFGWVGGRELMLLLDFDQRCRMLLLDFDH